MSNLLRSLLALSLVVSFSAPLLQAETEASLAPNQSEKPVTSLTDSSKSEPRIASPVVAMKFNPFTGKISKNKVRMRLQPTYDGFVIRELNHKDLIVVLGETEDFYAVQPPADFRAYVFRTFILDNVVEGTRVNVRVKPELDAPVVAQLNSGDHVEGTIHPTNNKWLEIKLPTTARFYIAKEFIDKVGDAGFKARLEKKYAEASQLLHMAQAVSQEEMQKPFDKINMEGIKTNYNHIMFDYPEFPEVSTQAKDALAALQDAYITKKLVYLENQSRSSSSTLEANKKLAAELQAQKNKISTLEQQIEQNRQLSPVVQSINTPYPMSNKPTQLPVNMSTWLSIEESLFNQWSQQTGKHNPQDFYDQQRQQSFVLTGIIDSYTRPVKNRPGDYMLVSSVSQLPIAFLYSTHINLQDYLGHEVSVVVSPRDNHNFAFPAYFVLTIE